jgi:uncharacterized MAPEG superfamily protein
MTTELYWLTLTIFMTSLFWLPYILDRFMVRGIFKVALDRNAETAATPNLWAQRAYRAHQNAIENLVLFIPAVLIAHAINLSTPLTREAVEIYFFARLAHYILYTLGVPVFRTLTFLTAWASTLALLLSILKVV